MINISLTEREALAIDEMLGNFISTYGKNSKKFEERTLRQISCGVMLDVRDKIVSELKKGAKK